MSDVLTRGMMKMVKSLISPEQIKSIAADLINKAVEYKNSIDLDVLNGEADAAAIFYEVGGEVHFAVAILGVENEIIRFENIQTLESLIEKLMENY